MPNSHGQSFTTNGAAEVSCGTGTVDLSTNAENPGEVAGVVPAI